MSFVHLHVHSEYSLLDGFSHVGKLVKRAKEMGMPAIALTDHGAMYGVVNFFNAAIQEGIKPIIGIEAYMAARSMKDRDVNYDKSSTHLLLLAQNQTGYMNLIKIASAAQLEGFYYVPRIDHDFLQAHSEGLIATSGCMSAEIPRAVLSGNLDAARSKLDWYYEVFGPDRFFLELQNHSIPELDSINRSLLELGTRYSAKFVATNDVHYINPEDHRLQDVLLAIQTGTLLSDPNRMRMTDNSYYLRTPDEMAQLFAHVPGAISNTLEIAEMTEVDLSSTGNHLPLFEVPDGYTPRSYLCELVEGGLVRRYGDYAGDPKVRERFEYELSVINKIGFETYFLIVWDLCRYARERGIWYNARGSAAGSLIAYTLDITLVEPLAHNLLFERFLNPDRSSMPDIDLDFQDDKRAVIMEYCAQKYGDDRVAQIITFGTLGARGAIRDVGRVMDIPLTEVDRVAKMIPNIPGKPIRITEALERIPEFRAMHDEAPYLADLIDTASAMEGVARNAGTHAAGVIITDRPIIDYIPLHRNTSASEENPIHQVTQFEMSVIDSLGLLKVDFLGLSTLTVMAKACELIAERHDICFNLDTIPLDDPETYTFLGQGNTAGVFQLEGTGMTRFLCEMKPQNLDNIIAMVALYRPGPMEFISSYIRRMHQEEKVDYLHPALKPIFEETYGIPIYQEQIMRASMQLAGYSPAEADDLRKAISKKMADKLEKHQENFVSGAVRNDIDHETASKIFHNWENFARYGFNKSHAADYGIIAVRTAYLKTHFPVEYMTALLSASKNDTAKVAFYIADCRSIGIDILPPDVNHSGWDFTIEGSPENQPVIRFGLGAIKNVGQGPVEMILEARQDGPFMGINDFIRRVDLRQVGKRALESLIRVGAMDSFGPRSGMLEVMDRIIAVSVSHFRAVQSGQMSFFGSIQGVTDEIYIPYMSDLDSRDQLQWEKELLGLYISDHPLSLYLPVLKQEVSHFSSQLGEEENQEKVTVAGIITKYRHHHTKSGKQMGFVTLEDIQGSIELVVFPQAWEKYNHLVELDRVVIAQGRLDAQGMEPKVLVSQFRLPSMKKMDILMQGMDADKPIPGNDRQDEGENGNSLLEEELVPLEMEVNHWVDSSEDSPPVDVPADDVEDTQSNPLDTLIHLSANENTTIPNRDVKEPIGSLFGYNPEAQTGLSSLTPTPLTRNDRPDDSTNQQILTIDLRTCGDKSRDVRRLRTIHGMVLSCPGEDHFLVVVHESGRGYMIEFPNEKIQISDELVFKLRNLVGEENVNIRPIL